MKGQFQPFMRLERVALNRKHRFFASRDGRGRCPRKRGHGMAISFKGAQYPRSVILFAVWFCRKHFRLRLGLG